MCNSPFFCRAVGAGHARPAASPLYRFNLQFVGEEFIPPVHLLVQPLTWFIL